MSGILDRPWRNFPDENDPWTEAVYKSLKEEIVTHELLEGAQLEYFNVLLIGQISAGKSSFYNTVESVFAKNVTRRAIVGQRDSSLTTKFRTYKVKAKDQQKKPISFRFCDTMGLSTESGLPAGDYGKIMDGFVQDGADLRGPLVDGARGYNTTPVKGDKMHCVAFIVDASKFAFIPDQIVEKFNAIRDIADERSLTPIVILTRIDQSCAELDIRKEGDVKNVFRSKTIYDTIQNVSKELGVSEGDIFPVQNYSIETEKDRGVDVLALRALRQILRSSETFLDDMVDQEDERVRQLEEEFSKLTQGRGPNVQKNSRAPPPPAQYVNRAPPPPATSCTALYDRKRESGDQVDMFRGEKFQVVKQDVPGGWTLVKNSSGSSGLVPTNWIKIGDHVFI